MNTNARMNKRNLEEPGEVLLTRSHALAAIARPKPPEGSQKRQSYSMVKGILSSGSFTEQV